MNSNRPVMRPSAFSSTFKDATRCSAPRSTPSLSSSCIPFYPRSHNAQLVVEAGFDGAPLQDPRQKDDTISDFKAPSFYNQQYYAGLGSDVPWTSNNENVWGCLEAWQWGDSALAGYAYAEGDAENPSFNTSHCLSYYPDSPAQEDQSFSCALSNIPSEKCAKTSSYVYCRSDAIPEQGKHGDDMGSRVELANASTGSKLHEKFTFSEYSPQSSSSAGAFSVAKNVEPANKQGTNDSLEGSCFSTQSNKLSKGLHGAYHHKQGFADANELKHVMWVTSGHTESREALSADVAGLHGQLIEGEVGFRSSLSLGSSQQAPVKAAPTEKRNQGSSPEKAHLLNGLNAKQYVETSDADAPQNHHDKVEFSYGQAEDMALVSSGSQSMIKSINNLCQVLLSIQSGTCSRDLGHIDSFAIERAISMLSELLLYSCVNESGSSQAQRNLQDTKEANDATGGSGVLDNENLPLDSNIKTGSARSAPERRHAEAVKLTNMSLVADDEQGSGKSSFTRNVKKQVLDLQNKVIELQEVVAYERSESNITVSTYKQLWSKAQEALEFSRSETMALREELTHLKEELRSLKPIEPSSVNEGKSDGVTLHHACSNQENSSNPHHHPCTDLEGSASPCHHSCTNEESSASPRHHSCSDKKISNDERSAESFKSSIASLPKSIDVLTGYFDPVNTFQRSTTCIERRERSQKDEQSTSRESHLPTLMKAKDGPEVSPTKPLMKPKTGPLENEVARRLSLLLSRPEAGQNDTCAAVSMDPRAHCGTFEASYGEHLMENDTSAAGMSSLCQEEDEVEIICLRSGAAESSSASARGELEWEHVIVSRDLW